MTYHDRLDYSTSAVADPSVGGSPCLALGRWLGRWELLAGPVMSMGKPWDCSRVPYFGETNPVIAAQSSAKTGLLASPSCD